MGPAVKISNQGKDQRRSRMLGLISQWFFSAGCLSISTHSWQSWKGQRVLFGLFTCFNLFHLLPETRVRNQHYLVRETRDICSRSWRRQFQCWDSSERIPLRWSWNVSAKERRKGDQSITTWSHFVQNSETFRIKFTLHLGFSWTMRDLECHSEAFCTELNSSVQALQCNALWLPN